MTDNEYEGMLNQIDPQISPSKSLPHPRPDLFDWTELTELARSRCSCPTRQVQSLTSLNNTLRHDSMTEPHLSIPQPHPESNKRRARAKGRSSGCIFSGWSVI